MMGTDHGHLEEPAGGRSWLEYGVISAVLLAALVISAFAAYYQMYAKFAPYDDEGFVLISLKHFFDGRALYDAVYSCYQPFFSVFNWLVFSAWGAPICHDSIRVLTIVIWLAGASLSAAVAYRLTSSGLLSLVAFLLTFRCMDVLCNEPGHPQGLAFLLVTGIVALFAFAGRRGRAGTTFAIGVLLGLLLLTKINIGVYALLAACLALAAVSGMKPISGPLFAVLGVAMVALPAILMRAHLADIARTASNLCVLGLLAIPMAMSLRARRAGAMPIVLLSTACAAIALPCVQCCAPGPHQFNVALLVTLSILAAILTTHACRADAGFGYREWAWLILGGALASSATLAAILLRGTSLYGLLDGMLLTPARQIGLYFMPVRSNLTGDRIALAGLACCAAYLRARVLFANRRWFANAVGASQVLFGVAVLLDLYVGGATSRVSGLPNFWPLPFVWLLGASATGAAGKQPARLALMAMAVMQPLIAYPVGGSQLGPATALLSLVGVVCVASGVRRLVPEVPTGTRAPALQVAMLALATAILLGNAVASAQGRAQRYESLTPLDLPGASRIRLPANEARTYQDLVLRLDRPEVDTFLTYPGLNSLYVWARKDPPTGVNVSTWMLNLDDASQERIRDAADRHPGLVVVRNRQLIGDWTQGRRVDQRPLVRYIDERFAVVERIGGYELMKRRDDRPSP